MNTWKKYFGLCLNILVPIIVTLLICILGPKLIQFFLPMVVGLLVAMIAAPLVRLLEKRLKLTRRISIIFIILLVIGGIFGFFWAVIGFLLDKGTSFIQDFPDLYDSVEKELAVTGQRLAAFLPMGKGVSIDWNGAMESFGESVSQWISTMSAPAMDAAGSFAMSIPNVLVYSLIALLSAYFFLVDFDRLSSKINEGMPGTILSWVKVIKGKSGQIVGGYFIAQFKIMAVMWVILTVALTIVKVSYSGLVALAIAALDFLPFFGTGTVLGPWALIKLINGDYGMALFFVLLYGGTQLVRQLIQPKLLGDSMGLNPLLTLFFLFLGYRVGGFTGMILAVPLGMIFMEAIHMGIYDSLIESGKILYHDLQGLMRASRQVEDEELGPMAQAEEKQEKAK